MTDPVVQDVKADVTKVETAVVTTVKTDWTKLKLWATHAFAVVSGLAVSKVPLVATVLEKIWGWL